MGSDPQQDEETSANQQPQHSVTLESYTVARFPVTVAEYACFVRTGHAAPSNWQAQQGKLDHPVVSVSWRDATGYAAWLAQTPGQPWPLPTEPEREKPARG